MTDEEEVLYFLEHFGIKGMHWGVRHDRPAGVSRRTDREASKDAKEFARAKQFFGEGAGTRRKLIKATVEDKSKKSASYARAFQQHLAAQDVSKHVEKAKSERRRKDITKSTKQRAGFLARHLTGEMGTKAAFTALAVGGAAFLASPKGKAMMRNISTRSKGFTDEFARRRGAAKVNDILKKMQ